MNLFKFLVLFNVINVLTTQNIKNDSDTKILSRKRRYLTFPEGSSLQLIYDQTIPIVGIELVFTIGITVALAWELPSEPLYKLTQKLRYRLKHPYDDDEGEKKEEEVKKPEPVAAIPADHDHDAIFTDSHDHDAVPMDHDHDHDTIPMDHDHDIMPMTPMKDDKSRIDKFTNLIKYIDSGVKPWSNQVPMSNKYDYYFNGYNKPATSPIKYYTNGNSNYYSGPTQNKFSLNNLFSPENRRNIVNVVSNFAQKLNGRPLNSEAVRRPMYPVFGKRRRRSLEEQIRDEEDKIFIEHHRTTRKVLYKKIERFLVSHKRDGEQCVLKALCETGQQHHEKGKGTFVAEIMRVIFSLPKSTHNKREEDIQHYDMAHQHGPEKNCAKLFPKCEDSIWSSDFIF